MWHAYGVSEEEMSASGNFSYFLSDDDEELRGKKKKKIRGKMKLMNLTGGSYVYMRMKTEMDGKHDSSGMAQIL
jgi:hypothetical protein